MPRLIYRGDSTQNFGRLLPSPYIENIVINNTTLDITVSLFINAPEDVDDSDEIIELVKESVYLNFVIAANMSEDDVSNFTSGQLNLLEYIGENRHSEETSTFYISALYGSDPAVRAIEWPGFLDDYENYSSIIYDDQGNRFKRITKTLSDISIASEESFVVTADTTVDYSFYLTNYQCPEEEDCDYQTVDNVYMMVFTSINDLETDEFTWAFNSIGTQMTNLMAKEISDISYEKIIEDGEIVPQTEVIWVDKKNTPYDGTPIQSLTSQYFKSENVTLEDIVDSMEDLLEAYETEANKHPKSDLASAVNNIAYVLSVYGGSTQLLPQLNLLKKMFTSKSTVKPVGKLYVRFRKRLFTFNKAVVNEERVFKKLVINPKIIDNTDPTLLAYEVKEVESYDESAEDDVLYQYPWYGYSANIVTEVTDEPSNEDYSNILKGFFFLDYQKLIDNCNAAKIFDIHKLKSWFGANSPTYPGEWSLPIKLSVDYMNLSKTSRDSGELRTMLSTGRMNYGDSGTAYFCTDGSTIDTSQYVTDANTGTSYYSYIAPRNFRPSRSGSMDDYMLMCYEFQFVKNGASGLDLDNEYWDDFYLTAETQISDTTQDIIKEITGSFYSASVDFSENYLAYAQDHCSYNEIDGKFNQFFIDGMTTTYDGNMENAPWLRAPLIYCLNRDLLFDEYDGDTSQLIEAAKTLSMKISPYTGILDQAESFYNAMISLYNTYYAGYEDELNDIPYADSAAGDIPKNVWDADQVPYRTYDTVLSTAYYPITFEEEVEVDEEETPYGYVSVDWVAFTAAEDGAWDSQTTESLTLEQLLARMDEKIQGAIDYANEANDSDAYEVSVLAALENTLKYMITTAGNNEWTSDLEKPSVEDAINYVTGYLQSTYGVDFSEGEGVWGSTEASVLIVQVLADFWLNFDGYAAAGWLYMPMHLYDTYGMEMGYFATGD